MYATRRAMTAVVRRALAAVRLGTLPVIVLALGAALPASAEPPPEWTKPVAPFRIAPNVYYVGTQGLSAYLITSADGAVLLDGTAEQNAALVERNIESLGVPLKSVKWLLSDHAHSDHVGALARIKRDSGARFAASAGDRVALESGLPRGDTDYDPRDFRFPPVAVDRIVKDGDRITVGDAVLTAHLTPGHTPGCTSWSMTVGDGGRPLRVLFLCSLTVAGNVLVGNRAYPGIVADFERTFAKLARMQADIVLPSHPDVVHADVLGRAARAAAGEADAFVDSGTLANLVAFQQKAFTETLAKARRQDGAKP